MFVRGFTKNNFPDLPNHFISPFVNQGFWISTIASSVLAIIAKVSFAVMQVYLYDLTSTTIVWYHLGRVRLPRAWLIIIEDRPVSEEHPLHHAAFDTVAPSLVLETPDCAPLSVDPVNVANLFE